MFLNWHRKSLKNRRTLYIELKMYTEYTCGKWNSKIVNGIVQHLPYVENSPNISALGIFFRRKKKKGGKKETTTGLTCIVNIKV